MCKNKNYRGDYMKLEQIRLVNHAGIKAASGLNIFELSFENILKQIIQLGGPNGCGKTVLLHCLHPWSSLDLDDRSDLGDYLEGEIGEKSCVYNINDVRYHITHTHKPSRDGHLVSSSIKEIRGTEITELNTNGGVKTFNALIEKLFGINKYAFQFVINGTQVQSFASMNTTQRKTFMNKAMNIDRLAKMHKMATEDYRYTNKLISSLNNTREFLLSTYGSYEALTARLVEQRGIHSQTTTEMNNIKSRMDALSGKINTLQQQNVNEEFNSVSRDINTYNECIGKLGEARAHDVLVNEQIKLNQQISECQNRRNLLNRDLDMYHEKQNEISKAIAQSFLAAKDKKELLQTKSDLEEKLKFMNTNVNVTASSECIKSLIQLGQTINSICKEITTSLNVNHIKLFADLIKRNVDISGFLLQENSVLMDGEKEKGVISRIQSIVNNVNGSDPEECPFKDCLYRNSHKTLFDYFKSYQSTSESQFTVYDLEQMDLAYKNIQVIKRLVNIQIPEELQLMLNINTIMQNMCDGLIGVDIPKLDSILEAIAQLELRNRYIEQLAHVNKSLQTLSHVVASETEEMAFAELTTDISRTEQNIQAINQELNQYHELLNTNDRERVLYAQVQHLDIKSLTKRQSQLQKACSELNEASIEYNQLNSNYYNLSQRVNTLSIELKTLEDADTQYKTTLSEIEKHQLDDMEYKIIAESTSGTKGQPIISIREKMFDALHMTNRLLHVMYEGEIEILDPVVNESRFDIPFRRALSFKKDIRYGSQSEFGLLSLAVSLSLGSLLTPYNIPLIDEIDGPLDKDKKDGFILMLQEIMAVLRIEQLFLISHTTEVGSYEHLIHYIDLTEIE